MTRTSASDSAKRERLLLMAVYLHGQPSGDRPCANCWRVLRQAMFWAAVLDKQIEATHGQDEHPVVEVWYRELIEMTRKPDALIWGAGNLGDGTEPPASPAFTGCGLTDDGRRTAERLLATHPL